MEPRTTEPTPLKLRGWKLALFGVLVLFEPWVLLFMESKRARIFFIASGALFGLVTGSGALSNGEIGLGLSLLGFFGLVVAVMLYVDRRYASAERTQRARRARRLEHYRTLARREHEREPWGSY